jgi:hypothetical protein
MSRPRSTAKSSNQRGIKPGTAEGWPSLARPAAPSRVATNHSSTLVVIVSKDRALQLQGTLDSFALHCHEARSTPVLVLYRSTDPDFSKAYHQLRRDLVGELQISWVEERHFKPSLLAALKQRRAGLRYLLLLVDDCIFVRPFSLAELEVHLGSDRHALGVSLRLGRNTSWCYSTNQPQPQPTFETRNGALRFRWPGEAGDFGYPLELSSSLYRWSDLKPLLRWLPYGSPNRLEQGMARLSWLWAVRRPWLWCPTESLAFCIPVNKVQEVVNNRAGECEGNSATAINQLFLQGQRLSVRALAGHTPNACHEELELPMQQLQQQPKLEAIAVLICTLPDVPPAWLKQAISSTAAGLEPGDAIFLRVDGGNLSPGQRAALIDTAAPVPLHIEEQAQRQGLAHGLNGLIETVLADGRFALLGRMDADDISYPQRFRLQRKHLAEHLEVDIVGSWCREVDEQGQPIQIKRMPAVHTSMVRCLARRNIINHPTVLIRRELFASGLRYRTDVSRIEDYHLWISAAAAGWQLANLPEILLDFRRDRLFFQRRGGWQQARADVRVRWRAIRELRQWSLLNLGVMLAAGLTRLLPHNWQGQIYRWRGAR